MKYLANLKSSVAYRAFSSLEKKLKRKIVLLIVFQFVTNFLDILGVLAVGVLSSIALFNLQTLKFANWSISTLDWPTYSTEILLGGIIAALTAKTLLSGASTRSILYLLGEKYSQVSAALISHQIINSNEKTKTTTRQEKLYICTRGVEALYLQVLAPSLNMLADISLLILLLLGTFIINPVLTTVFIIFFGILGVSSGRKLSVRIKQLGSEYADLNISSNERIIESLNLQKEIVLLGKTDKFIDEILQQRQRLAAVLAESMFIPFITKYMVEIGVILGGCIAGVVSMFITSDKTFLVTLTIFMAVATRLTPAILRIQQGVLQIKNNSDVAEMALSISSSGIMSTKLEITLKKDSDLVSDKSFQPHVRIRNLSFGYSDSSPLIQSLSCEISQGSLVAIVGPSGSGKSTLVNLLAGFLTPHSGEIYLSGVRPDIAILKWPGKVAIVPQEISLISATVAENIALGVRSGEMDRLRIGKLLKDTALDSHVSSLPKGIDTLIGESGMTFSGGQRQRLGIARALYSEPAILFLDEATSALDGVTEEIVTERLFAGLEGMTIIVVAHRLSTVQKADKLIYLETGKTPLIGDFNYIRESSPNFAIQAKILGL